MASGCAIVMSHLDGAAGLFFFCPLLSARFHMSYSAPRCLLSPHSLIRHMDTTVSGPKSGLSEKAGCL